jgi:hypothetical protein
MSDGRAAKNSRKHQDHAVSPPPMFDIGQVTHARRMPSSSARVRERTSEASQSVDRRISRLMRGSGERARKVLGSGLAEPTGIR